MKNSFLKIIVLLAGFVFCYSKEPIFHVTIVVTDALGHSDSCTIYYPSIVYGDSIPASLGIDTAWGEQNIYGTSYNDPDIRIIQRDTISKYKNAGSIDSFPLWLDSKHSFIPNNFGLNVCPYLNNYDFKKEYRSEEDELLYYDSLIQPGVKFVVHVYSTHYPIIISIGESRFCYGSFNSFIYNIQDYSEYNFYPWTNIKDTIYREDLQIYGNPIYILNDSIPNHLIGFYSYQLVDDVQIINNIENQNYLLLSPNPGTSIISITNNKTYNMQNYTVFSEQGKKVKTFELNNGIYLLDISNFQNGVYFIKGDKSNMIAKFVKK
jgi:hypothetical protein